MNFRKYEKTKAVVEKLKKNEEVLKQRDLEMNQKIQAKDQYIAKLKVEVQSSMDK